MSHQWSTWLAHSPGRQWLSLNFEVLCRTYGRTDGRTTTCVKIVITTGRDCGRPRGSTEMKHCFFWNREKKIEVLWHKNHLSITLTFCMNNKAGVINDPLGQTPANIVITLFCFARFWKVVPSRHCGLAEWSILLK